MPAVAILLQRTFKEEEAERRSRGVGGWLLRYLLILQDSIPN